MRGKQVVRSRGAKRTTMDRLPKQLLSRLEVGDCGSSASHCTGTPVSGRNQTPKSDDE